MSDFEYISNRDSELRQKQEANNAYRKQVQEEKKREREALREKVETENRNRRLQQLEERKLREGDNLSRYTADKLNELKTTSNKDKKDKTADFENNTNNNNRKTTYKEPDTSFNSPTNLKLSSSSNSSSNTQSFNFIEENEEKREFTPETIATIDTINNVGAFMNDRIKNGVKKSLNKMDKTITGEENNFTPIAYPTIKLAEELGIQSPFSGDSLHTMFDGEIPTAGNESRKFNERDNSLGQSWVVNPPFQFNPNDDVRSNPSFPQYGRLFNEKINSNYPIVVFEVGTIKYSTSIFDNTAFQQNDSDTGLSERIRGGPGISVGDVIKFPVAMVATVLRTSWKVITLPVSALLGLKKFARFVPDTGLFAKYFNDISQTVAATLGLLQPVDINHSEDIDLSNPDLLQGVDSVEKKTGVLKDPTQINSEGSYAGIRRRLVFESVVPGDGLTSAEADYIPFVVGRDVSISESLSNTSQSNPLAAQLNSAAAEAAAAKINNYSTGTSKDALGSMKDQTMAKISQMKAELFRGKVATVISGEGRVTLPDIWTDSSFSRSVSLNFTFKSPYGHNLAVFENTYIPFLLLFCMSMPRQIGTKTFTNPFYVRVNMKGFFSIPMGIIESLSIERGEDKNDWTIENLPRTIKCSVTIKDLSPVLMMSMARNKLFSLFQGNDGLTSYVNTLGGLSLHDQRNFSNRAERWWKRITERQRGNTDNGNIIDIIDDTLNPFSYAEGFIRSHRSGFIGRTMIKLSQVGLNPFEDNRDRNINY